MFHDKSLKTIEASTLLAQEPLRNFLLLAHDLYELRIRE